MSDAKRMELRQRIEAGKARQVERGALAEGAAAARDRLTSVAREHPLMLIAGGLAIGVALSTLIPRSPTRRLSKNAVSMIAGIAELGILYGRQAMEAADGASEPARDRLGQIGGVISDGAARLKRKLAPEKPAVEAEAEIPASE
ncbi:hypothetical protein SZ64_05985 [Erythrobacter sp. SG61-1L]|uniref:hypothetical protein n=1 Tax=Erythrobacter sp. SG61-1L TaxID=1603897 RepID=UPI0006C939AB|nr:hypothetical protein [Erythrobacter sp. SG61-1L]KPL67704.1 hypothetical protein SZ64_05985 [Erythrobacter sp. SG61-1L]